ncbi:hypothetical protein V5G24_24050 [Xanthobacter sp. VTT E-85241]|uniref:hypothetical protein n=1 Tax=Roseixanthobacter finlandensis TaxID=3119922 RepID=UPI0037292399
MVDDSTANADKSKGRFSTFAENTNKLGLLIVAIIGTIAFGAINIWNEHKRYCVEQGKFLVTLHQERKLTSEDFERPSAIVKDVCSDRESIVALIESLTSSYRQSLELAGKAADAPQVAPVQPSTSAHTPQPIVSWVAVGYSNDESNFSFQNNQTPSSLKVGDVIRASTAVNARPAPAAWGRTNFILAGGQCFKVASLQTLPAGGLLQIWASGMPIACP